MFKHTLEINGKPAKLYTNSVKPGKFNAAISLDIVSYGYNKKIED